MGGDPNTNLSEINLHFEHETGHDDEYTAVGDVAVRLARHEVVVGENGDDGSVEPDRQQQRSKPCYVGCTANGLRG